MVLGVNWGLRLGMLMLVVAGFDLPAQMLVGPGAAKSDAAMQKENVQPSPTLTVMGRSPAVEHCGSCAASLYQAEATSG